MTEIENNELNRGHKEYDSKVKNLEGIFNKIQNILDITEYKKELEQIQFEVSNDSSLSNDMLFASMQMDYEGFAYGSYNKRLDDLLRKVEEELLPFYELYLLSSKIDIQIANVTCNNIGDTIQSAKKLIDAVNTLNTHNIIDKNNLIDRAYKSIYSVIMYEEIFERSDILDYINHLNVHANRENIGRLLEKDLKNLSKSDLIEENLRTIRTEGLGYDYLNADFVRKVSRKTVGETNSEYQERKRQAILDITSKIKHFQTKKDELLSELQNSKDTLLKFYFSRSLIATKALSLVLIPIIAYSAGKAIGKSASDKITEYSTITRTIDLNTGEIIGEPVEVFDERETTYVATVMECSPWRKNPTGLGYIRNIVAYEYIVPENVSEDYHVTSEDLVGNVLEKYRYVESKDDLEENDSTLESTILITETYQDKSKNQKSTRYIVPYTVVGTCIGIIFDLALLLKVYGFEKTKIKLENLNKEIQEQKLTHKEIRVRLKNMSDEALQLQNEYNEVVKKYGTLRDQISIEDDYSWLVQNEAKRIRRK